MMVTASMMLDFVFQQSYKNEEINFETSSGYHVPIIGFKEDRVGNNS